MGKDLEQRFREFVNKLGVEFDTAEEVMDLIVKNQEERASKKEDFLKTYKSKLPLRPSSALACGRKLTYELFNFSDKSNYPVAPMSIRQERIFKAGDVFEEFELNRLSDYHGLEITHRQQALTIGTIDGREIRGAIDAILWKGGRAERKPYLLDIKSITTFKYREVVERCYPKIENFAQLCLYGLSPGYKEIMDMEEVEEVDRKAALFYVNKDSLEYHMIEFYPNQEVFDAIMSRFNKLYKTYKEGNLAPRDYVKRDKYPCGKYCSFFKYCQEKPDPDLKLEVPDSVKLTGDNETDIYNLWHNVGESSTYVKDDSVITIEPLVTKWTLNVEKQEGSEAKSAVVKSKKVPKKSRTNNKAKA